MWDPLENQLVGGYRFVMVPQSQDEAGHFHLSTTEIFNYTQKIKDTYFPYAIELGRSFVQPEYQPSLSSRKGLFSLDNLWDGLGALVVMNTEYKYFFGKITMYSDFNKEARDLILSFMDHYFPNEENLVSIPSPIQRMFDCSAFLHELDGLEYKEGHKLLNSKVRELGENIPPLFNSYMNLSPTMRTFGTAINHHFGDVEETGIMVSIGDIYDQKKDRHVRSYTEYLESL